MKIIGAVPFRELQIEGEINSFCAVSPSLRAGDNIVFSVAAVIFNEEGDRGNYRLTVEMTDPTGEILYKSASDIPAGNAGYYTVEIQTVAAKVTSPGLYHLDISLENQELFSLPLIFTLKER